MTKGFNTKFFLKSLTEITGPGMSEFYSDNLSKNSEDPKNKNNCYTSGRPKLFQKLIVFLSGLETSFGMDKRDKTIKTVLKSLTKKDSAFQTLITKEYSKVDYLVQLLSV